MEEKEYYQCEPGESQYEGVDLTGIVEARYVPARLEIDKGNPYVEGLPLPLTGKALKIEYETGLPEYHAGKNPVLLDELMQIHSLRNVRFRLPFHKELEEYMYNTLVLSYRARRPVPVEDARLKYTAGNEECYSDNVLCGDAAEPTNGTFSLIGPSGCGKSCGIGTLVGHYPQAIRHKDKYGSHVQIVYLVVNCAPNSNMAAVYQGIGAAIDKALGNVEPVYEAQIEHVSNLGKKLALVKRYIELFSIGIIILDEIQLLRFDGRSENSFEAFMVLSNETKCAIAVVGTEDAKDKVFHALRTSRRLGMMIEASRYCGSKGFFAKLVEQLFQYQWFSPRVEVSDELVDVLYDVTKGIIDQLITVYICVCLDYVKKREKGKTPVVDGEYIRSVVNRRYPGIQKLLEQMDMDKLYEMNKNVSAETEEMIDEYIQEEQMKEIAEEAEESAETRVLLENVVANVRSSTGDAHAPSAIEAAFKTVMRRKSSEGLSEVEVTNKVFEQLFKAPKRKTPKKTPVKSITTEQMKDALCGKDTKEA